MSIPLRRTAILFAAVATIVGLASGTQASARTVPAPPPTCAGSAIAKPGGGYWACSFDDEFNSYYLDTSKWSAVTTQATSVHTPDCFENSSNNVTESGGYLTLTTRKTAAPFTCTNPAGNYTTQFTSGEVTTNTHFSQTYGRFEIKAEFPASTVAGLQSSLWLWPTNSAKFGAWPLSGEIDIAEEYSQYPTLAIPFVHYIPSVVDMNVTSTKCTITPGAFHDYVLVWTSSNLSITIDGTTCISDTWSPAAPELAPEPFNQPFFLNLTQGLGVGANAATAATQVPASTVIDYVRIYH